MALAVPDRDRARRVDHAGDNHQLRPSLDLGRGDDRIVTSHFLSRLRQPCGVVLLKLKLRTSKFNREPKMDVE